MNKQSLRIKRPIKKPIESDSEDESESEIKSEPNTSSISKQKSDSEEESGSEKISTPNKANESNKSMGNEQPIPEQNSPYKIIDTENALPPLTASSFSDQKPLYDNYSSLRNIMNFDFNNYIPLKQADQHIRFSIQFSHDIEKIEAPFKPNTPIYVLFYFISNQFIKKYKTLVTFTVSQKESSKPISFSIEPISKQFKVGAYINIVVTF